MGMITEPSKTEYIIIYYTLDCAAGVANHLIKQFTTIYLS